MPRPTRASPPPSVSTGIRRLERSRGPRCRSGERAAGSSADELSAAGASVSGTTSTPSSGSSAGSASVAVLVRAGSTGLVEDGEPEGSAGRQRNLAVARGGAEQWDEACSAADLAADLIRPRATLGVVASEVALVRNEALAVHARLPATLPANLRRECLDAFAVLEESLEAAGDRGSALELRRWIHSWCSSRRPPARPWSH